MLKLYFKKMISVLGTVLVWFAVSAIFAKLCGLSQKPGTDYVAYSICLAASGVVTALLVGKIKLSDMQQRREYLTDTQFQKKKFLREIWNILKSKAFISELAAFATLLVPLMVYVCQFPENADMSLSRLILTSVVVITELTAAFALLDLLVSLIVRKLWMKGY